MTLAQADALARVTGTGARTYAPVVPSRTITDARSARRVAQAWVPDPTDSREFREIQAMFPDRYGK